VGVSDLHIECASIFPTEADPPPFVDPDAVLTLPVPFQSFQMITGRNPQVMEEARPMKAEKISPCGPFNSPKARHHLIMKQSLSRLVSEGRDHGSRIVRETSYYKRITR